VNQIERIVVVAKAMMLPSDFGQPVAKVVVNHCDLWFADCGRFRSRNHETVDAALDDLETLLRAKAELLANKRSDVRAAQVRAALDATKAAGR